MDEQHNTIIREQEYSDAATQRTIIDLIDAESGEFIDANMLDTMTEAELTELKELQSLAKKSGKYKYVCAVCGQPLRLDSRHYASRRYKSYFFSHYSNGDDCPLKTSSDAVDPVRSTINWYGKFKVVYPQYHFNYLHSGLYWSASYRDDSLAYAMVFNYEGLTTSMTNASINIEAWFRHMGLAVRLVQDKQ